MSTGVCRETSTHTPPGCRDWVSATRTLLAATETKHGHKQERAHSQGLSDHGRVAPSTERYMQHPAFLKHTEVLLRLASTFHMNCFIMFQTMFNYVSVNQLQTFPAVNKRTGNSISPSGLHDYQCKTLLSTITVQAGDISHSADVSLSLS